MDLLWKGLELFELDGVFFVFLVDEFEVLFGGTEALVANQFGDISERGAAFELVDDKGVAKIVDFSVFDTGEFEVAVDGGADVAD